MKDAAVNAIIGGSNKCGTTSLFRYLGDHPAISACSKKELGFFLQRPDPDRQQALRKYLEHFPKSGAQPNCLLEATPTYLDGGRTVAGRINAVLNRPKLIFILREPSSRLISYFKSKDGLQTSPTAGISFDQFLEKAFDQVRTSEETPMRPGDFGWQLTKAHYGRYLLEYLEVFNAADILVVFFEDLVNSPNHVTSSVCSFLDVDPGFFADYSFSVENRSRVHRSSLLRTLASQANALAEPLFNRYPIARKALRAGYDQINVKHSATFEFDAATICRLEEYYRPVNDQTSEVLRLQFGLNRLPSWLDPGS